MNKDITNTITSFKEDLSFLFEDRLIDVVIYGSAVRGDFIYGKSDIDFIVFINAAFTENDYVALETMMSSLRNNENLSNKLEGTFIAIDDQLEYINSYYAGTNVKGWKRLQSLTFNNIESAMMLDAYLSMLQTNVVSKLIKYDWIQLEAEIELQIETFRNTLLKYQNVSYHLYALKTSLRSLYTLTTKRFISKNGAIDWIIKTGYYKQYNELLMLCKRYNNPLNDELDTLSINDLKDVALVINQVYIDIKGMQNKKD